MLWERSNAKLLVTILFFNIFDKIGNFSVPTLTLIWVGFLAVRFEVGGRGWGGGEAEYARNFQI